MIEQFASHEESIAAEDLLSPVLPNRAEARLQRLESAIVATPTADRKNGDCRLASQSRKLPGIALALCALLSFLTPLRAAEPAPGVATSSGAGC